MTRPVAWDPDRTYFFVHVMKTGGTTFVQHINANFGAGHRYPPDDRGLARQRAYYMIDELRALTPEQRQVIQIYAGHFPFVASQLVEVDVTMAILRDPVERTLSYLRDCKRDQVRLRDLTLEEIYEDGWVHPLYVRNYQSKLFAMTLEDKLESHLDVIEIDGARLAIAMDNLERLDLLGLTDRYDDFLTGVQDRYGWTVNHVPNLRVSTDGWDVPRSFRSRIAAENAADVAFYERAREIHGQRRR